MSFLLYLSYSPLTGASVDEYLSFIFLLSCPQLLLFCFLDLIFILCLFVFFFHKLFTKKYISDATKPLLPSLSHSHTISTTWRFKLSLVLSILLAVAFLVLFILSIFNASSPFSLRLVQSITLFLQSLSNFAAAGIIINEKAISHLLTLRLYWLASFILSLILSISSIICLFSYSTFLTANIISLIFLLFSSALLFFSISPSTGIHLLPSFPTSLLTGYSTASTLFQLTWSWMNPLLTKGYKTPLKLEDIPSLSLEHRAK